MQMVLASDHQEYCLKKVQVLEEPLPEPLSKISGCLDKLKDAWSQKGTIAAIWQDWPKLVGDQLASNCRPISLKRGTLIIGASLPQWRQALIYNRSQLLSTIKSAGHKVKQLKIQQYHPRAKIFLETEYNIWEKHPSRTDIHGMGSCIQCKSPAPQGEIKLWGKCIFCRRKDLGK